MSFLVNICLQASAFFFLNAVVADVVRTIVDKTRLQQEEGGVYFFF